MSYTFGDLILDMLNRSPGGEPVGGMSIPVAANAVQSMVYKRLLERGSDLLASGSLSLTIPAYGYSASLPADFVAFAERPHTIDVYTDWMVGTVTSYDDDTGVLVANITACSGTGDSVATWSIALGAIPGSPASTVGSSATTLTVGTGAKTLTTQAGLTLVTGDYILISTTDVSADWGQTRHRRLQPFYLDDDLEHCDSGWWNAYGQYEDGCTDPPCLRPSRYKIVGTTLYVRPKPILNVIVKGRYNAKPTALAAEIDIIPWNGFFDEVFREGTAMILATGVTFPDSTPAFAAFLYREVDAVINSRIKRLPERRLKRANWL